MLCNHHKWIIVKHVAQASTVFIPIDFVTVVVFACISIVVFRCSCCLHLQRLMIRQVLSCLNWRHIIRQLITPDIFSFFSSNWRCLNTLKSPWPEKPCLRTRFSRYGDPPPAPAWVVQHLAELQEDMFLLCLVLYLLLRNCTSLILCVWASS